MRVFVDGSAITPAEGWTLTWVDGAPGAARPVAGPRPPAAVRLSGIARLSHDHHSVLVVVEGIASDWHVVLLGRRIPVTVQTWREELLAEAERAAHGPDGPLEVTATLPGLVVAVAASEGDEVAEGDPLLTIEAMKMQNEVRAPRAGRVGAIAVEAGQTVTTGQLLLRLE
jgi:acetyl/propionyl-CoA carboxylase alpha subunit